MAPFGFDFDEVTIGIAGMILPRKRDTARRDKCGLQIRGRGGGKSFSVANRFFNFCFRFFGSVRVPQRFRFFRFDFCDVGGGAEKRDNTIDKSCPRKQMRVAICRCVRRERSDDDKLLVCFGLVFDEITGRMGRIVFPPQINVARAGERSGQMAGRGKGRFISWRCGAAGQACCGGNQQGQIKFGVREFAVNKIVPAGPDLSHC